MASVIIRLPDKDKHMLELIAQQQNTTVSDLVRQAVGRLLVQNSNFTESRSTNPLLTLAKLAKEQAQDLDLRDMPTDLSTTFKKVLYK